MVIVMAAAIVLIPAIMFPVLKEHNEAFALGYVVTRTVEVVLLLPAAVGPLPLLAASPPQINRDGSGALATHEGVPTAVIRVDNRT